MCGTDRNKEDATNKSSFDFSFHLDPADEERMRQWVNQTASRVQGFLSDPYFSSLGSLGSLGPFGSSLGSLFGSPTEAFPVPSLKQYQDCVEHDGTSLWTADGVWRCLFKGQTLPVEGRQFKDYTSFLEYQRMLVRKHEAEADARLQRQLNSATQSAPGMINQLEAPTQRDFPGNNRPRLIAEDEARGKRVVSQNEASEVVTLSDGSLETRTQLVKYFDDGTAFMKRSTDNQPKSKGWFWN